MLFILIAGVATIASGVLSGFFSQPTVEQKRGGLPLSVFRELPEMPEDFGAVKALLLTGDIDSMCDRLNESYWKQPEFYPLHELGYNAMLNYDGRRGISGYGAFPAEAMTGAKPGDEINTCFFIQTAWVIDSVQGLKLNPVFPDNIGFSENGFGPQSSIRYVEQNGEQNKKYFTLELSQRNILLMPTWGIFKYNWTQKINVKVKVSPNTPPGRYIIGAGVSSPDAQYHEEWLWKYKTLYTETGGFGTSKPPYLIGIEVVNNTG